MQSVIIDVREHDEFNAEHIESAIHIPLSVFDRQASAILKSLRGQHVVFMCHSGKRAALAAQKAGSICEDIRIEVFQGGILEWKQQGKPTVIVKQSHLPIMRQVQLIAGSLVVIATALAYWVNPKFIFLAGFVGAGLTVAGATGFCGMAEVLAKLPWNKGVKS